MFFHSTAQVNVPGDAARRTAREVSPQRVGEDQIRSAGKMPQLVRGEGETGPPAA